MDMDMYQNSLKSSFKIFAFHGVWILPQKYYIKNYGSYHFPSSCKIYQRRKRKKLSFGFLSGGNFFFHLRDHHLKWDSLRTHRFSFHALYQALYAHISRTDNIYQPRLVSLLCPWTLLFLTAHSWVPQGPLETDWRSRERIKHQV